MAHGATQRAAPGAGMHDGFAVAAVQGRCVERRADEGPDEHSEGRVRWGGDGPVKRPILVELYKNMFAAMKLVNILETRPECREGRLQT